ncbi:MAG: UDP-3-O-(3-hydroxymyristoyl)glucosamine N-acyltransferase [Pseudomonadota bacterium]|nr:UDP-3-O-(3-hydroxymyristoyl)glucosamine N-acyltransferase [Burkholderiales bacterium]
MLLTEIIAKLGGKLVGADINVNSIKSLDLAAPGEITFISESKFLPKIKSSQASAVIIKEEFISDITIPAIVVADPFLYYAQVSQIFNPILQLERKISSSAKIDISCKIGNNCAISDNVVIGKNVVIGDNTQIYPNVVINDNVIIGNNVTLFANISIYSKVMIGNNTVVHAGVVIGADGFGYAPDKKGVRHKIPQVGGVKIGNNVEIGANTTIDGGTFSPTIIEDGVVIDNLVQIAHNVTIGSHTAIAANTGIAGSTKIGKFCIIAGHAGIGDHVNICDYAVVGGLTGVGRDITKPGLYTSSYPFNEFKEHAKIAIRLKSLNDMFLRIKALEDKYNKYFGDNNGQ